MWVFHGQAYTKVVNPDSNHHFHHATGLKQDSESFKGLFQKCSVQRTENTHHHQNRENSFGSDEAKKESVFKNRAYNSALKIQFHKLQSSGGLHQG
jgi:hypothetical protein